MRKILIFLLFLVNFSYAQNYILIQLKYKPEIFICDVNDLIKIHNFRLLSECPYYFVDDNLIIKHEKYVNPNVDTFKIKVICRTFDQLMGYNVKDDSIVVYFQKDGLMYERIFYNNFSSMYSSQKKIIIEEERNSFFEKIRVFNKDSSYLILIDQFGFMVLDRNRDKKLQIGNPFNSNMGLGNIPNFYYNPQFINNGNQILIEKYYLNKKRNDIEIIDCEKGIITKICDNCINPHSLYNSGFILFSSNKYERNYFKNNYYIYDFTKKRTVLVRNIRTAFLIN